MTEIPEFLLAFDTHKNENVSDNTNEIQKGMEEFFPESKFKSNNEIKKYVISLLNIEKMKQI